MMLEKRARTRSQKTPTEEFDFLQDNGGHWKGFKQDGNRA